MHIYQGREPSIPPKRPGKMHTSGTCSQLSTRYMQHAHAHVLYVPTALLYYCLLSVSRRLHPPSACIDSRTTGQLQFHISNHNRHAPRRAIKRALFQRVHLEHTRVSFAHAASPRPACHGALTRTLFLVSHGMWAGGTLLLVALARHNHVSPVTTLPHPPQSTRTSSLSLDALLLPDRQR